MAEIEGKIELDGVTTEFRIPDGGYPALYQQWGADTAELGKRVEFLYAVAMAAREHLGSEEEDKDSGCSCGEADSGAPGHEDHEEDPDGEA